MTKTRAMLAIAICLAGCLAAAQDVSSVASHAPPESCLAVTTADVAATCEAFQTTRLGAVLCGPDFTPLIDELIRREMAGPLNLQPAVGFDWRDLAKLHVPGGLFVFELADSKLGAAWIFSGRPSGTLPEPLATALRYFDAHGFARSVVRKQGAVLAILKPTGRRSGQSSRALFVAQDFYGVANSPEAAETLLAVRPEKSLAADAIWQQANLATGPNAAPGAGEATVLVRPIELWELARRASEDTESKQPRQSADAKQSEEQQEARDPLASSRQLGFDGVRALAGRAIFSAESDHDWQLKMALHVPRPYEKALRLLALRQGPLPELPDWLAADATSTSVWRWDFPTAMKGFGNLFDEANEPGPDGVGLFEDMLDGLRDDPEGVQVDLRREVFEQLGPDVLNVTDRLGPPSEEAPNGDRTLYVARIKDADQVIDALKRFYRGDERVTYVRSGDYDVWTVPEGSSLFVEGESDSVVMVRALAVGGERMLFGTDVEQLQTAISASADGQSLKDDPDWSRLWKSVQERHGDAGAFWAMSRLDQVLEPAYARAITNAENEGDDRLVASLWRILLFGTADKEAEVPYAAAPPYDRLRGGLPPASIVLSETPDGFSVSVSALGGAEP